MRHLGDFAPGATIRFLWETVALSGASITRATDGTISVYKDGSTTQTEVGVTDTEDFDALAGIHLCTIVTTDAFYTPGSIFHVVLSLAVIDGQTVNAVLASFTVGQSGRMGRGTAQGGATANIVLAAASAFADDVPNGWLVVIVSGTGAGQARVITDYDNATDTATIAPAFGIAPDNTSVYELFAGVPGLSQVEIAGAVSDAVLDAASTDHQVAGSVGNVLHTLGDGVGAAVIAIDDLLDTEIEALQTGITTLLAADVMYKRAAAVTGFMFYMELTDGSPGTSLTVAATLSKDGAAFAGVAGAVTEVSDGWYKHNLTGTEMTADEVALKYTATGAKQRNMKLRTQS